MGFSLCLLGRTPGGWTWGCLGLIFFPKHSRVAYQIVGDGEQDGIQVKFSPYGQTCDLSSSPAKVSSYLPFDKPFVSRPSKFFISAD